MTEIAEVAKYIRKELKYAEQYAYEAAKHKEQYPELAQRYYRAAMEHMALADDLHAGAVRLIDTEKARDADDKDTMQRIWGYEHEMLIDEKECIQRKLDMYKA